MSRSPYQPSKLPRQVKTRPVSSGYPPVRDPLVDKIQKKLAIQLEEKKAQETLREAGVESTAKEFLNLLESPEKLKEVITKLKLKAFW